jgi:hypothetical protein
MLRRYSTIGQNFRSWEHFECYDKNAEQNHRTERGRAASVSNSNTTGRPRRSVLLFGEATSVSAIDYSVFGLMLAFGIWWLVLPKCVIRFYCWFHKGWFKNHSGIKMPTLLGVRLCGALWIVLLVISTVAAKK